MNQVRFYIGFLISVFGINSFGNTLESVFQKNTIVPIEVQTNVFEELGLRCARGISMWGLNETGSVLTHTHKQSTFTESEYTIQFDSRYYFDGMHPITQILVVSVNQRSSWIPGQSHFHMKIIEGNCPQD